MEKISVITTVYNRFEYLRNTLICLMNQTKQIHELIIADDGSSQKVLDYIEDLVPKCEFKIKHVYQNDMGFRLARSRNNAALQSEGDYLIFLDQDVVFEDSFIEEIFNSKKNGEYIVFKAVDTTENERDKIQDIINENYDFDLIEKVIRDTLSSEIEKVDKAYKKDKLYTLLYKLKLKNRGAKILGLAFALHREDYFKVNGFDENYESWGYEDDDFGNRLFKAGVKSRPIKLKFPIMHMYHAFDPTKAESANKEYYYTRKKEMSSKNYQCKYGVNNRKDLDEIQINNIK